MSTLTVDRIESEEALNALGPAWRELEVSASGNGLPFCTFAWVTAWWRHLREDGGVAVRDRLAMRAVRRRERPVLVSASRLSSASLRPGVGPPRLGVPPARGGPTQTSREVRGALCQPSTALACHEAILADISERRTARVPPGFAGVGCATRRVRRSTDPRWAGATAPSATSSTCRPPGRSYTPPDPETSRRPCASATTHCAATAFATTSRS